MSKKIAYILDRPEAEVAKALAEFEKKCGYPSEDVRLLAENKHRLRSKLNQIGLDPDDTTDEELYYGLLARYEKDSQLVDDALGISRATPIDEKIDKAIRLLRQTTSENEVWILRKAAAKKILTQLPPKQVAKRLGYRSVTSLIKREDLGRIYLLASKAESANWQKSAAKLLARLNSSNYELCSPQVVKLRAQDCRDIEGPQDYVVSNKYLGVAAIWPSQNLDKASTLSLALMLANALHSINGSYSPNRLHQISPAIAWWSDCNYLISDGSKPISFNLKDVAINHLKGHDMNAAVASHAASSFWDELTVRYHKILASLADEVPDIQISFDQPDDFPKMPLHDDLAVEYATLEE